MKKKKLALFLSQFLIVGLLVTGCGQAKPTATTPSTTPPATSTAAEDPAKVIKSAVETYFNDIGSKVTNSYKIPEKDLKDGLDKSPDKYVVLDIRRADAYALGHIKGAINVPYSPDIAKNLDRCLLYRTNCLANRFSAQRCRNQDPLLKFWYGRQCYCGL